MTKVSLLQLTEAEMRQLYSYCEERDRDGWYYGDKKQFEKRHAAIKNQLEQKLFVVEKDSTTLSTNGIRV